MSAAKIAYQTRMQRVLAYIDQNLTTDLSLDTLSKVAAYSKFHFHRQFSASFGLSVHSYVQLARMKQAAYELAYRQTHVTEIAIAAGFEAPDAFARAFRQKFSQSPSEFRASPDWENLRIALEPFDQARRLYVKTPFGADQIEVRRFPETPIAYLRHTGSPREIGSTLSQFINWRKANRLHPDKFPTYTIYHDDPRNTPEADYREDFCVGLDKPLKDPDGDIRYGSIPAGRCAVLRVIGDADNLEKAVLFLYRDWLPESKEELRDFPIYCQRLSLFPDVPAHETITDLFLPLKEHSDHIRRP